MNNTLKLFGLGIPDEHKIHDVKVIALSNVEINSRYTDNVFIF